MLFRPTLPLNAQADQIKVFNDLLILYLKILMCIFSQVTLRCLLAKVGLRNCKPHRGHYMTETALQ
jgi:hypothetical protein